MSFLKEAYLTYLVPAVMQVTHTFRLQIKRQLNFKLLL